MMREGDRGDPAGGPPPRNRAKGTTGAKVRLLLAAAAFLGWLGYLGYAALSKSRGPVVSRVQAAAAQLAVRASIDGGADPAGPATVLESLTKDGPPVGTQLDVVNLNGADVSGWAGTGEYLLFLERLGTTDKYRVVGQQRSPGYDLGGVGKATIYRWSSDVEAQAKKLVP